MEAKNNNYIVIPSTDGKPWSVVPEQTVPAPPDNVVRFDALAAEISLMYERKNTDYGDSFGRSVEKYGLISALTRISDKFNRLESLILKGEHAEVSDESLDDTLKDLAAYCIMTVVARQQQKTKRKGDK